MTLLSDVFTEVVNTTISGSKYVAKKGVAKFQENAC